MKKFTFFLVIIIILSSLCGCCRKWIGSPQATRSAAVTREAAKTPAVADPSAPQALRDEVLAILETRAAGVNKADGKAYLATALPSDPVLFKEEENLIRAAGSLGITDYAVEASAISQTKTGCTAQLKQTYTLQSEKHSCKYTAAFVSQGGKLYYAGPAFILRQNDKVKVHYLEGREQLASDILDAETEILDAMKLQLGFIPEGSISVKLFEDQAVFLQSIKLDLPEWVGGWHEYGEAVKTFVGAYGTDVETYRPMLAHESTHRMVSELSNDNAAYWLQEGLAGVYEELLLNPDLPPLSEDEARQAFTPFAQQKTIDLEKLGADDWNAVSLYYASSKAYAAFLVEQYGWGKVKQMLEYMKKKELIPVTGAEKMAETNERTSEAIAAVLGLKDDAAFQADFDSWIAKFN